MNNERRDDGKDLGWPGIYIAIPMTGIESNGLEALKALGARVGEVAREERYFTYLPWLEHYPDDPQSDPTGQTFEEERRHLLRQQLLVVVGTQPSTGVGRLLQIAEDNLIEVLFVQHSDQVLSRMARGEPNLGLQQVIGWSEDQEAIKKVRRYLRENRKLLIRRARVWPERNFPPACSRKIRDKREPTSREDLAKRLALPRRTIATIEEGYWIPSLFALRLIASALDTYAGLLFADSNMDGAQGEWHVAVRNWAVKNRIRSHEEEMMHQRIRNRGVETGRKAADREIERLYRIVTGKEDEQTSFL